MINTLLLLLLLLLFKQAHSRIQFFFAFLFSFVDEKKTNRTDLILNEKKPYNKTLYVV